MLGMTGVKTATTTKSKPNREVGNSKIRNDNRNVCNLTRLKEFSKDSEFGKIGFFISETKLAFF